MGLEKFLSKFTLLQALVMTIILALLAPIPITLYIYSQSTYEKKQEELVKVSYKKFELAGDIFTEALWNFYPELAQITLDQLALDKNFVSIKLLDGHKKNFLSKTVQELSDKSKIIKFEKVLSKNGDDIGFLEMYFKKDELWDSIREDIVLYTSLAIFQAALIILVISILYFKKILQPIKRVLRHSDKLAKKDLEKPFVWSGDDEINNLGRALEKTRVSLKRLFTSLYEQNITLDEKVQKRTQELEEASQYKSEFLANMSHEIRTPMNAIVGMSHLMSKTELSDTQSNYIIKIKDASAVLLRIINDILDFSKIEAGKLSIEQIAFDLHKEIRKSTSIFSILAKEKDVVLESDFANTHRFYRGDPYRIIQILNNFLSNAVKFTKAGSVKISIEEHYVSEKRNKLIFSVKDTGIGIDHEKQTRLFQAFGQLDTSTTRKYGGTGLGLYICTQLAKMMDGEISFESTKNIGSIFCLELELDKVEGIDIQKEHGLDFFVPLNILLVEDDLDAQNIIIDYIRSFGFFVTAVASYEEARALLQEKADKFDLFIFDYHLQTLNGISTYEHIKNEFKIKIPAILITADIDATLKAKAINAGFERFLQKPIKPSFLYDDITSLCEIEKGNALVDHSKIDFSKERFLIVEDNDINLEVALYLLNDANAQVDIARNGFEAVEAIKSNNNKYDVVLMDIQMPVMDGYEAAKIIRNELKFQAPIVAMTANVMAHDIKKCLDVGMNEHIGKPLEVEDFYGTLLKVLGKQVQKSKLLQEKSDTNLSFDKQNALNRLGKNEALWKKIFCNFYEKYNTLLEDIETMRQNNDVEALKLYIHSLKGLCGTIGASKLQKQAILLDTIFKENTPLEKISFENLFASYKEFLPIARENYEKECSQQNSKTLKKENKSDVDTIIEELETALERSSISKVKKALEELAKYDKISISKTFQTITLMCSTFEFESAKEHLTAFKKELQDV